MRSTASPSDFATCAPVVGESSIERFALGAAIGIATAASSARATGCAGTRTATDGRFAVTASGIIGRFGSTSVNGPGQKASSQRLGCVGPFADQVARRGDVGDVDDQRIVRGTSLGDVDALDRARVERVGAKSVDGFRRKRDEAAAAKEPGRARNDLGTWVRLDRRQREP